LVFDETNRGKDGKLFFFPGKNEKIKGSTKLVSRGLLGR